MKERGIREEKKMGLGLGIRMKAAKKCVCNGGVRFVLTTWRVVKRVIK